MVFETASTPSGAMTLRSSPKSNPQSGEMILRSSTKTNTPPCLPVHEGSPMFVSKRFLKQKADKISATINMEGEDESEELHGSVPLKVRTISHFFVYVT